LVGVAGNRPPGSTRDAPARRRSRARDRLGLCRGSAPYHARRQAAQGGPADGVRSPPQSSWNHLRAGSRRQTSADEAAESCSDRGSIPRASTNNAKRDTANAPCPVLRFSFFAQGRRPSIPGDGATTRGAIENALGTAGRLIGNGRSNRDRD